MSRHSCEALVRNALANRVRERTYQGERIAAHEHMTSPRGGVNLNRFGQHRSAPGESPAVETGHLLSRILNGSIIYDLRGEFAANYVVLEYGYDKDGRRLEPRPNGRRTVDRMKREQPQRGR